MTDNISGRVYSLEQLATLVDLPLRTVRFYIQKGLVPRPTGTTRNASYDVRHLEPLLRIRAWSDAGLSLSRIADLLLAPQLPVQAPRLAGTLEVRSHIHLDDGVELVIAPDRAGLTPEQVRAFIRATLDALAAQRRAPPLAAFEPPSDHHGSTDP